MLQIAICDDEPFYRKKIQTLVTEYFNNHDLTCQFCLFSSGQDFLAQTENSVKYDIVFMDISMDAMNGIQTAMQMRAFHSDTFLVLVTAFIDYVLEGYKVNAMRYLLKNTLEISIGECLDAILQKMQLAQVSFSFTDGNRKLHTDNILYIESQRHKSIFYYMEASLQTYEIYCKLDAIEQKLCGYDFLRIHKSYLVNMKHIRQVRNYTVLLSTGSKLPVPRLRFQEVKEAFVVYKGAL